MARDRLPGHVSVVALVRTGTEAEALTDAQLEAVTGALVVGASGAGEFPAAVGQGCCYSDQRPAAA